MDQRGFLDFTNCQISDYFSELGEKLLRLNLSRLPVIKEAENYFKIDEKRLNEESKKIITARRFLDRIETGWVAPYVISLHHQNLPKEAKFYSVEIIKYKPVHN